MAPTNHLFVWGVCVMCIMVLISTYVNQKSSGDLRNDLSAITKAIEGIKMPSEHHEMGKEVSCKGAPTMEDVRKLAAAIESMKKELYSVTAKLSNVESSCQASEKSTANIKQAIDAIPARQEKEEPKKEIPEPKAEVPEPKQEEPQPKKEEEPQPKKEVPEPEKEVVVPKEKQKKRMVVAILASYTRGERRQTVRETWLQITKGTPRESEWTYKFFLANPDNKTLWDSAHQENKEHNDIIFFDHFLDTYRNLSRKTLAIAKWTTDNYDFEYLFKTDDDAFVRLDRLLDQLDHAPKEKYFAGISNGRFHPERDPGSIWYVSEEDWPTSKGEGPNVVTGAGYVLTRDCAEFMAKKAADPNMKYIPLEDVNTAVVLSEYGVEGGQLNGFLRGVCPCSNEMVLTHWCNPTQLRGFYSTMQRTTGNQMC